MKAENSSSKKRYSIFNDELFKQHTTKFQKIPYHFQFNTQAAYIIDHHRSIIATKQNHEKGHRSKSKNKIFQQRRSVLSRNSINSNIQRSIIVSGSRNRTHSIFNSKKNTIVSQDYQKMSIMDRNSQEEIPKLLKIQSLPEEIKTGSKTEVFRDQNYIKIEENQREQLEKKVIQKEKQIIYENFGSKLGMLSIRKQKNIETTQRPQTRIMKPEELARVVRQARINRKSKRNHVIVPIPMVITEVDKYHSFNNDLIRKDRTIYRI